MTQLRGVKQEIQDLEAGFESSVMRSNRALTLNLMILMIT